MNAMPKIGVALYSSGNPFSREGNVACEYRGQPFEFISSSDLPSQTLWITNASFNSLVEAGLHRNPKIAHEGYYRTRLSQVSQELGIGELSLAQQVAFLAEVLGNSADIARYQLGFTQYPSSGIANAVGQLHGISEAPSGTALLQIAEQACQRYTACERERRYEKADVFSFWFPRFDWANWLINEPLPSNDSITAIPAHSLPNMGRDVSALVDWAHQNKIPMFARIKIRALEQVVGKLMNYGAGAQTVRHSAGDRDYEARNFREWCSLPELEALSQSGDIEVLQVAVANGWCRSGLSLHHSKVTQISYAYGLVAENMWVGLTRRTTPNGNTSKTLRTAWIQSLDRMRCMRVAERLYNLGMEIINYGNGRITVVCPLSVRSLIPQIALEEQLLFPASLVGLVSRTSAQQAPFNVSQHLISNRDYKRIIEVDQRALAELKDLRK